MIATLRIDERLIHGQIMVSWLNSLGVTHVVVANDAAAKDNIAQMTLKMSLEGRAKLMIRDIPGSVKLLNDPRCEPIRILVIVNSPADALALAKGVPSIREVNLGNYGHMTRGEGEKVTEIGPNVVFESDVAALRELVSMGLEVFSQKLDSDPQKSLKNL